LYTLVAADAACDFVVLVNAGNFLAVLVLLSFFAFLSFVVAVTPV
jgi:hypothetical protein